MISGRLRHNRRTVGFFAVSTTFVITLAVGGPQSVRARPAKRPNVLIIMTDDHRAGAYGVMPELKRLFRRQGTRFPNAFATTPTCCPSRASFMTGRYAHNHGVLNNDLASALDQSTTLQRHLQDHGYATALFGKYLNSWSLEVAPPFFDRFATFKGGYYDRSFNVDGQVDLIPGYTTNIVAQKAIEFIGEAESRDRQPWLMFVTPWAPHLDAQPAPEYKGAPVSPFKPNPAMLEEDRTDKPRYVQADDIDLEFAEWVRRRQLRTLMSVDDLISDVFASLTETNEDETTLAFFVADNGMLWEDHGLSGKGAPYRPAAKIPFFMRWPNHVEARYRDDRLVANIDLAPTVFDGVGIPAPESIDGRSLFAGRARDRLLLETFGTDARPDVRLAATLTQEYEYAEYYAEDSTTVTEAEFYDFVADPWQLTNLLGDGAAENDPQTEPLAAQIAIDRKCAGSTCP